MKPDKLLIKGLGQLGFKPSDGQAAMFMSYLGELKRWNRAYSLTSLKTDEDIVVKHFLDSCLYLLGLPNGVDSVADVGSGAGFPGLPIEIMRPGLKVYLIESSAKKCSFLRHMARTLKLEGIGIIEERVEDVEALSVDAAVTRALFSVREFVKVAGHIVKKGGLFVLNKGPKVGEELEGMDFEYSVASVTLPVAGIERKIIMVRKQP